MRAIADSFGMTSMGGLGLTTALFLVAVLAIILPSGSRAKARLPLALIVMHLIFAGLSAAIPEKAVVALPIEVTSTFFLLTANARSLFVLVVDGIFAGRLRRPLPKIVRDILQAVVFIAVALTTLRVAGVEPSSLLTTSALLTAVVGLSLQETLGNLFAGLSIQAQTPFEVGDWIGFDQEPKNVGRVIEINWRATKVITHEEIEIIIPNGTLAKAPIRNFSKPTLTQRRTVEVGCTYDVSPRRVREVILAAISGTPHVLSEPSPIVEAKSFGLNAVEYSIHFYTQNFAKRYGIEASVRERIWYALRRAQIGIPYSTHDVFVHTKSDEAHAAEREKAAQDRRAALRKVDFLAVLPPEAIEKLASLSETRIYGGGEIVIQQGEGGEELFVVMRGHVHVMVGRDGGSMAEVARLGPGQFFGEMSLMTGDKRAATVQSLAETELLVVGKGAFGQILSHAPELAEKIADVLAHRQEQLDEHIAERSRMKKPEQDEEAVRLLSRVRQFFQL
jgi:small-conductance mechanosensitive channel/CRP-like cAMP-binding protein